ncbi:hypothetical protein [Clostridium sp.]|uniref:hypothetical protein n=1 Tax=Clostridium sp. TaxID=1506 RepID=UPI003F3F139C
MRIYTLEQKGEVLAILKHDTNMSYRKFKEVCEEANEEAENDFYTLRDILTDEHGFELVEACGGYETSKRKGNI